MADWTEQVARETHQAISALFNGKLDHGATIYAIVLSKLKAFATAVEAETREECAKVCDRNAWNRRTPKGEWVGDEIDCVQLSAQMAHEEDAAAIRSLPQASAETPPTDQP